MHSTYRDAEYKEQTIELSINNIWRLHHVVVQKMLIFSEQKLWILFLDTCDRKHSITLIGASISYNIPAFIERMQKDSYNCTATYYFVYSDHLHTKNVNGPFELARLQR